MHITKNIENKIKTKCELLNEILIQKIKERREEKRERKEGRAGKKRKKDKLQTEVPITEYSKSLGT